MAKGDRSQARIAYSISVAQNTSHAPENGTIADLLARMPLFAVLSHEVRGNLARQLRLHSARRGELIYVEGEPGHTAHIVLSGKVKSTRSTNDGRERLLAMHGPGDMFGELSLLDPGPRVATATALTKLEYASLDNAQLKVWLTEHNEASWLLLQVLGHRLRQVNEDIADLFFADVPGRVAKALLDLGERFGTPVDVGLKVEHGLTQEELAQLVGASRETVNKALSDFASQGWLQLGSRAVVLLDRDRLIRRARW